MSNFAKPLDKIIAKRMLRYGIRLRIINLHNFGFIKGIGCIDVIAYILDMIYENRNENLFTHLILLDFHAAFDTGDLNIFFDIISNEFKINGSTCNYLQTSLRNRRSKVKINGFIQMAKDVIGFPQGWPPSPICFIFLTADLDMINWLELGLKLINYADDNAVISDGTVRGKKLNQNINYSLNLINFITYNKHLIMETSKQKYIVFDINGKSDDEYHLSLIHNRR